MNLIAISSCHYRFFSPCYHRANIPSVVPFLCLNSSCSSSISPYTTALILPSRILSSNFNIWLSNVMLIYLPGSCKSLFLFHIRTINSNSLSHRQHLYSHFANACLSFRIGLHDKQVEWPGR